MMQDSIDFGTMNIPKLFRMMFPYLIRYDPFRHY